jgi:hypothetical protein
MSDLRLSLPFQRTAYGVCSPSRQTSQMPPSNRLFKYEAFSTRSLLNLKKQIIYFGSPLHFNDPYDCAISPSIAEPSDQDVEEIRAHYMAQADVPAAARKEFQEYNAHNLREIFVRSARKTLRDSVDDFLAKRGVACFSERNDDLLMWSHYGGQYKGFCLEFDTAAEPFQRIFPVRYVTSLPAISVRSLLLDDTFDPIQELFCTKSDAWSYEREWRALHDSAGTEYGYPSSALKAVYFGPDIDQQTLEVICLVLLGQNDTVRFFRGQRSGTEFKVTFEPFTYISYLEAKRSGLLK